MEHFIPNYIKSYKILNLFNTNVDRNLKLLLLIAQLVCRINLKPLWLKGPKGATPINKIYAINWQMTTRRDNVISIILHQVYVHFLNQILFSIK